MGASGQAHRMRECSDASNYNNDIEHLLRGDFLLGAASNQPNALMGKRLRCIYR
jgi:hypothetical protein